MISDSETKWLMHGGDRGETLSILFYGSRRAITRVWARTIRRRILIRVSTIRQTPHSCEPSNGGGEGGTYFPDTFQSGAS